MKTFASEFVVALLVSLCTLCVNAKANPADTDKPFTLAQATAINATGQNIDVLFQQCDWTIDPRAAKNISGSVTTQFKTIVANVSVITFDFNKAAFNNASLNVKYSGVTVPFSFPATGNVNIISINLPTPLPINTIASVVISYSGAPPAASGLAYGFQKTTTAPYSVATLSESHEDKDWWPCKADMRDKVDAMDINVTVPWVLPADTFWVASNGVLTSSPITGSGAAAVRTFRYKTTYPIASYLVAIGVSKYTRYERTPVDISGTLVPVSYYIFPGKAAGTVTSILNSLDKSRTQLLNFSDKFGDYPFKNEKHGYYEYISSGMEHQTFSGMGTDDLTSWSTIAHELAHQWFGDKVTFATWSDIWLAEGFASYGEILTLELDPTVSATTPASYRNTYKTAARSVTTVPVYIPAATATSTGNIFGGTYGSAIYRKGPMVVSMLRKLVGDDMFFLALKNYMNDPLLAYKSATTTDLKNHFEAVCGFDLDPFFDTWIYKKGHCDYTVKWGNNNQRLNIELTAQINKTTGTDVTFFSTPVVLKIAGTGAGGVAKDTTVVIYHQNGIVSYAGRGIQGSRSGNRLGYQLSFVPTSVTIDPLNETMMLSAAATNDAALNNINLILLDVAIKNFTGVGKNGGHALELFLEGTTENVSVQLERSRDGIAFQKLAEMTPASANKFYYTDKDLVFAETYFYRAKITDEKGTVKYSKVVKLSGSKEQSQTQIKPNPASKKLQLFVSNELTNIPLQLSVYNAAGAVVLTKAVVATGAMVSINISSLPSGTYSLMVVGNNKNLSKSFSIVQ